MKKFLFISFVILTLSSIAFFTQPPQTNIIDRADLWQGEWISEKTGKRGEFAFIMEREGDTFSGKIKISDSPLTKGGNVSGTIQGDEIKFGLAKDKKGMLTYAGKISKDTMSGTWKIPVIKDHGTWYASKK